MGAEGGMSSSMSRGGGMSSSDIVPPLPHCLPLEPISLGSQKYTRSGELRRALGFPLGSATEDHPSRFSSYKPSPPVATEELKQIKDNILDASIKAKERSRMFCESIYKIDKFMGSKKRQRTEILSSEKPGGSGLLKLAGQPLRNQVDQSAQRLEDKAKCAGLNKRFRSSAVDLRVDSRSGSLSKDQISYEKDTNVTKPVTGPSVQPEERIRRLSAVGEWDKNKRKRSVGTVANRSTDSDVKRTTHSKSSTDSKLALGDTSTSKSNANRGVSTGCTTVIKGRISRAPRTGSVMAVNSSSDVQASSEACEGWEQSASTNKVIPLGLVQNHHRAANSSHTFGQWAGQRQQKSSRSRRTNVVSPVTNHDEGPSPSLSFAPSGVGAKSSMNGTSGFLDTVDVHNSTPKSKMKVESASSPVRLSEGEETRGVEHKVEEKGAGCIGVALNGKGKARAFLFPTKRNKHVLNDNVVDGVRRQGRTMRGLSLSRPGVSQPEAKTENVSVLKPAQNMRPDSDKIRSKSGRPPSKKMLDGRSLTRTSDSDDDHEELLAAATSARKASYLACSGRFWKKVEPIFGPVSLQDASYLKQQLSFAQELEDSLPHIPGAGYNILGICMHKEKADISSGKQESRSYKIVDKDEGLAGEERRLDKFSSLYQRVLSALIEEDECEGIYNGTEGISMSLQCASDDSHCGSCNYADADTRDRDRLESEAESIIDFQIQKRCVGDRFSCNMSVTSNTTRNVSMSDSLYSSGRWLGDDCLSHSDVEFISGSCHNDQVGVQPAEVTVPGTFSDGQYQLMCVDDRLIVELQSIGLYLDTMPDLAEGEEVIDQDITELMEGLSEQIGKKKHNLVKIDKAIEEDKEIEKRYIENVAMEQLIQMAYKRRMACRRNNASKTVMRKVSKQVAMGFIERTLARCKNFELTGRSCFSEPALQNVIFAAPQSNDGGACVDVNAGVGAPKRRIDTAKADSTSFSMLDPSIDEFGRGSIESSQTASLSSEHGFPKVEPVLQKGRKRELLLDDVGGTSSRGTTTFDNSLVRGAKGKRSERDRDHSRGTLMTVSVSENHSVGRFRGEQKQTLKPQQNLASVMQPLSNSIQQQSTGSNKRGRETGLSSFANGSLDDCEETEDPIDFSGLPMPDFDSIEQLGISNDPSGTQDFDLWLDGLQEDGSEGLHIPMDDLSMIPPI